MTTEQSRPSRRRVLAGLAGLAGGAVSVAGWSPSRLSWVTAADASGAAFAPLPALDGTLVTDPATLQAFAGDFGRVVTRLPGAVLRPGSVRDVVAAVRYARRHGLHIAVNGQGGMPGSRESHSNHGQATVAGGIAVDAKSLATIHSVGRDVADVDAGVTWAALVDAAAAAGRTPPVLTDFLHLSIGGTLSVGGLGGTSHRYGTQADNVVELQVVTGAGDLVTCSRHRNAALFDAVLVGAGQCGLVVRAKVRLVPAHARALSFSLFYDDAGAYLADQATLVRDGRFAHLAGQVVRRPDGTGWRYMIDAAAYSTPPQAPDPDALLAGLSDNRAEAVVADHAARDWAFRLDAAVAGLTAGGFWTEPHLWVSVLVPESRAAEYAATVTGELSEADLGAGIALFYPLATSRLTRPLLPRPGEPVAYLFSLLRFPAPGTVTVEGQLAQNRRLHDAALALGGKRYNIGAVPGVTAEDWRRHFGPSWGFLARSRARFDPDGVLTPGQGIFG